MWATELSQKSSLASSPWSFSKSANRNCGKVNWSSSAVKSLGVIKNLFKKLIHSSRIYSIFRMVIMVHCPSPVFSLLWTEEVWLLFTEWNVDNINTSLVSFPQRKSGCPLSISCFHFWADCLELFVGSPPCCSWWSHRTRCFLRRSLKSTGLV